MLDYIIDTFADSPHISTDSPIADKILHTNLPENEKEIDDNVNKVYPFALVLWNDETHSFNEVISQVTAAIECDTEQAGRIAEQVDQQVFHELERKLNKAGKRNFTSFTNDKSYMPGWHTNKQYKLGSFCEISKRDI